MGCWRVFAAAKAEVFCSQNKWSRDESDDSKHMKAVHESEHMRVRIQQGVVMGIGRPHRIGRGDSMSLEIRCGLPHLLLQIGR